MTKLASWVIPTYRRLATLPLALDSILRSHDVEGWEFEVVFSIPKNDPSLPYLQKAAKKDSRIRYVHSDDTTVGGQRIKAFSAIKGELVMLTDDDVFQSPERFRAATEAYDAGHNMSGCDVFYMYNRMTDVIVRWEGPNFRAGPMRNFAAQVIRDAGGWDPVPKNCDWSLTQKFKKAGIKEDSIALPRQVGLGTVTTHNERNISSIRAWPQGATPPAKCGLFLVHPVQHHERLGLPMWTQTALEKCYIDAA